MQRILTLFSSVIHSEIVRTQSTPSVPLPETFHTGDDFRRWARAAQDYIELVPTSDRRIVLLSLIEGEVNDIVRDEGVLDVPITPETFQRLRDCLTDRLYAAEFVHHFQIFIQLPGERLASFVRALRRLAVKAFPDTDSIDRDAKVLTQILVSTRDPPVRRRFLLNSPPIVAAALDAARRLEQVEAVLSRDQLPEAPTIASVSSCRPQRPFRPRYNQGRPWYPSRQPLPTSRTSLTNCYYCQRFGTDAGACGHNRPGESTISLCACHTSLLSSVPVIDINAWDTPTTALVDTGAECSLICIDVVPAQAPRRQSPHLRLIAANGTPMLIRGQTTVPVAMGVLKTHHPMIIVYKIPWPAILEINFLYDQNAQLHIGSDKIPIGPQVFRIDHHHNPRGLVSNVAKVPTFGRSPNDHLSNYIDKLLVEFPEILAHSSTDIGRPKLVRHRIETGNAPSRSAPHQRGSLYIASKRFTS
ncbi:unnamed protein product [Echinostoma caproni]|uniref:RVP domain-containing protein n=1 Tax=Echinostoma caproni TaxID=27848 RepID=A0A183BGX9_9TREM|nr:unnamed protein product [Echinostoma caproni]